jgi:hypothetical protein
MAGVVIETSSPDIPTLPTLNRVQITLIQRVLDRLASRLIDVEGAIRLGKSWGAVILVWLLALLHPGIRILLARWKQEDADGQLVEVWDAVREFFPRRLWPVWVPNLHAYKFKNGSVVYRHGLKASENEARNSKWRGKTLAVVVIDQAEECPEFVFQDIQGRLSQSANPDTLQPYDYPLHLILIPNSVDEDHWIAEQFPVENANPDRWYLQGALWDNAENLGPKVIAGLEAAYPEGDPQRVTLLEGKRGPTLTGKPVYGGKHGPFKRSTHVSDAVAMNGYYPVLVGWDFGEEKPAVVFAQYNRLIDAFRILGAVKGKNIFAEDFVPKVLEIQARWFPGAKVFPHADPSGATGNQGMRETPIKLLQDLGVPVRYDTHANDAEVRYLAIQTIGGFMRRTAADSSPAFLMNPRCIELEWQDGEIIEKETSLMVTAFTTGYVWAENTASDAHPNIRKPKKGTRYDDLMNAAEYIVIGEKLGTPGTEQERVRERARVAKVQHEAAFVAAQRANRMVGPTGETLQEALDRVARESRGFRDTDRDDRRWGRMPVVPRGGLLRGTAAPYSRRRGGW